ncbi:MAG: class II glutamine amidotransferase [Deltaproteobacteria bacterium]|nr:class II glutamine amidotransferase [Deltaproteobacteria bacterium]
MTSRFGMCELFGMWCATPSTVSLSFTELAQHGGGTAHHTDGWGIAYHDGRDARLFREPSAAVHSPLARYLAEDGSTSSLVLAHVRKATMGENFLVNTQPFLKDIGGRLHVFAHNGRFDDIACKLPTPQRRAIGDTDSEQAFCVLVDELEKIWAQGTPSFAKRVAVVRDFARRMCKMGPANFLLTDGELLFAHANMRTQLDGSMAPPGMVMTERSCYQQHPDDEKVVRIHSQQTSTTQSTLAVTSSATEQHVVLFASVPLTDDEEWRPLDEGELVICHEGKVLHEF